MVELLAAAALALAGPAVFLREGEAYRVETELAAPRWYRFAPIPADYANPLPCPRGQPCAVPIRYAWVELVDLRGQVSFDLAQVPALGGPGTHRLRASDTPLPAKAREEEAADTFEIVVRRDDSYAGFASELVGVPFVLAPAVVDGVHQADARRGADCVALVIYGQRRLGRRGPYVSPAALVRWLEPVEARPAAGDVLHFGFQTAILAEDRGEIGVLDAPDLVLHTFHGLAEYRALGELPYRDAPVRVLRWPRGD